VTALLPAGDVLNEGHSVHAMLPARAAYVPAAQFWQVAELLCPVAAENLPAAHFVHAALPTVSIHVPPGHGWQLDIPTCSL